MNEDAYSAFSQDNKGQEGYVAAGWVKDLKHYSTADLLEELKTREGVEKFAVRGNEYCVISALDIETNAGPVKEYNDKCIVIVEVD